MIASFPRERLALGGLFLVSLIVLLPLRLVMAVVPALSARAVHGTVWWGNVHDLHIKSLALGNVEAGLSPLSLLIGRRDIWLRKTGSEPFAARLGSGTGWLRVDDVEGTVPLVNVVPGIPVTSARFSGFRLHMDRGRCVDARGQVQVSAVVAVENSRVQLNLSGQAHCRAGKLALPLAGAGGMDRLDLMIDGNGRWTASFKLLGYRPKAGTAMPGFSARQDGIVVEASGMF